MTETETNLRTENEAAQELSITPVPHPEETPFSMEKTLRRLEEQSVIQTRLAQKRLFWGRLSAVFIGVTMAVVVLAVVTLTPRVQTTLDNADLVMGQLTRLSQQLQEADIPSILENLNKTLTQSRASLADVSEAVRSISSIDFASLNQAILDLQKVLRNPIGSLFGRG